MPFQSVPFHDVPLLGMTSCQEVLWCVVLPRGFVVCRLTKFHAGTRGDAAKRHLGIRSCQETPWRAVWSDSQYSQDFMPFRCAFKFQWIIPARIVSEKRRLPIPGVSSRVAFHVLWFHAVAFHVLPFHVIAVPQSGRFWRAMFQKV